MALKHWAAAFLLLATAVSTHATDCYAIETDMKVCDDTFCAAAGTVNWLHHEAAAQDGSSPSNLDASSPIPFPPRCIMTAVHDSSGRLWHVWWLRQRCVNSMGRTGPTAVHIVQYPYSATDCATTAFTAV